jgi:hypothetical protein
MLAPPRPAPLGLWRAIVGVLALLRLIGVEREWREVFGVARLIDAELFAEIAPRTRLSLWSLAALRDRPGLCFAVAELLACGLVLGVRPRACAAALLVFAISLGRSFYPLASILDDTLVLLLLGCLLLPTDGAIALLPPRRLSPGTRAAVTAWIIALGAFAIALHGPQADLARAELLGSAVLLSVALARPSIAGAGSPVGVAALLSAAIALLCVARAMLPQLGETHLARSLDQVAWDIGIGHAPRAEAPEVVVAGALASIASSLPRAGRIWSYLAADADPMDRSRSARARGTTAIRQAVADRACRGAHDNSVTHVFAPATEPDGTYLSFVCRSGRGHLVPRWRDSTVAPVVANVSREDMLRRKLQFEREAKSRAWTERDLQLYLSDSRALSASTPVEELLRLSELRYAAREFDEALRLIEEARSGLAPGGAAAAKIERLRDFVARADTQPRRE